MSGELGFYDIVVGNMGDRNDLALWWGGSAMIKAVAAVNKNTIVVVHSVGPVKYASVYLPSSSTTLMIDYSMEWSNHPNITGVIYAGAPGEQTGPGLVDVLWGLNPRYPSGKLPFAISDVGYSPCWLHRHQLTPVQNEADYPAPIVYNSNGFPTVWKLTFSDGQG